MEVTKIDARPLILLYGDDFDDLCSGIKDYQLVSDFFKQERLKEVEGRRRSDNLFRYKVTPLAVAVVAIAYPFYVSSPKSISALVADFALVIFGPFGLQGMIDLWKGGSFVGEELRLSRGSMTFENGEVVTNQTPELNFKEYILNKNLPEYDFELLLALMKSCLPLDQHALKPFSSIEKELKKIKSEVEFLFKIPFAKHTDLGEQLPIEIWGYIAKKASMVYLQNQETINLV